VKASSLDELLEVAGSMQASFQRRRLLRRCIEGGVKSRSGISGIQKRSTVWGSGFKGLKEWAMGGRDVPWILTFRKLTKQCKGPSSLRVFKML
jgi:hypothetical protein